MRRSVAATLAITALTMASCDLQVEQDTTPLIEALDPVSEPPSEEPSPSDSPSASPSTTDTPEPTESETTEPPTPRPTPSRSPSAPSPTTPTPTPTPTPSASPTPRPSPTSRPTPTPSPSSTDQPPVARDDSATVDAGSSVLIDVLANDSDPDGDDIEIVDPGDPRNGTVSLEGTRIRYRPDRSFSGTEEWTYSIRANGVIDRATISVRVRAAPTNGAPVARDDGPYDVQAGGKRDLPILANDSDPDGDPLEIEIVSGPSSGTLSVGSSSVTYVHTSSGSASTDRFTYRVVDPDGATSSTATASIRINRAPIARNDAVNTFNGATVTFNVITGSGTNGGTGNADSDPDGDTMRLTSPSSVNLGAQAGTVTCSSNGSCTWDPVAACSTYTATFTYRIEDGRGGSDTATVTLRNDFLC